MQDHENDGQIKWQGLENAGLNHFSGIFKYYLVQQKTHTRESLKCEKVIFLCGHSYRMGFSLANAVQRQEM